jgi:hypothetical protein
VQEGMMCSPFTTPPQRFAQSEKKTQRPVLNNNTQIFPESLEQNNDTPITTGMSGTKKKNPFTALAAGCIAGGIEATAVWPMEFIKVNENVIET